VSSTTRRKGTRKMRSRVSAFGRLIFNRSFQSVRLGTVSSLAGEPCLR
jgi:hypothetical protein